jgi:hypothetical protein
MATSSPIAPRLPFIPGKGIVRPQSQPNSYIHVFVNNLYIPRICPHIWLQLNTPNDPGNI